LFLFTGPLSVYDSLKLHDSDRKAMLAFSQVPVEAVTAHRCHVMASGDEVFLAGQFFVPGLPPFTAERSD